MFLYDFHQGDLSWLVRIHDFPPYIAKTGGIRNRLILIRVPSCSSNIFESLYAVSNKYIFVMRNRLTLEIHIHQNTISESNQSPSIQISVNLWVFTESTINHMFSDEFCPVFVKPICDEYRNIILPGISRSCTALGKQFHLYFFYFLSAGRCFLVRRDACYCFWLCIRVSKGGRPSNRLKNQYTHVCS